ncbi:MAG: hypothetical protein ACOCYU_02505 [Brevefilum sp.]
MKHLVLNRQRATTIRRVRKLPFPGKVLVDEGQSVHPEDLIAEAELPAEIYRMDIARGLGVDPSKVLSCLVRDQGEELAQDDVIAECDGAFPRLMRVPRAGKLLACRDGAALIAAEKMTVGMHAGMIGVISEILPEWGAVITTQGGLIQGVWGNGQVGAGILRIQASDLYKTVSKNDLKQFDVGQVLAVGFCSDEAVLRDISAKKPTGLILGWIDPRLIANVMALPFPVILLHGFGVCPLDDKTFDLLRERNGDVVCINASQPDQLAGVWPEIMLPNISTGLMHELPFTGELSVGQRVQVLSGPERGGIFTVGELPEEAVTLESGLVSKVVVLDAEGEEPIVVPVSNVIIAGKQDLK